VTQAMTAQLATTQHTYFNTWVRKVHLTGVHSPAMTMQGAILGFLTVDSNGQIHTIVCNDTGAFSNELLHVLLPVARLMNEGFEFFFRLPQNISEDKKGFKDLRFESDHVVILEMETYGGFIKCPDGALIIMVFDAKSNIWSLPKAPLSSSTLQPATIDSASLAFLPYDVVADVLRPATHHVTSLPGLWK